MSSARERWLWLVAMTVASAALVWAITSVEYLPTQDGPSHILSGHIENHFDDPGTIYSRHLSRAPQYASRGFAILFLPLERLLGWMAATRAVLAISSLVGAWATAWIVLALEPKRRWTALLPFAFAFPWTLAMGFFSYSVAMSFGIGVVAFVVTRDVDTLRRRLVVAAALGLNAHLHVFSALVTASAVWIILAFRAPASRRVRDAGIAALLTVPVFAVLLNAAFDVGAYRQMSDDLDWHSLTERALTLPRLAAPGSIWKGISLLALVVTGIATAWRRHKRGEAAHRDELGLAVCAGGFVITAAIAPLHVPGWQFFSPRFLQLGVALGLALLASERLRDRRRDAFAIGATLLALFGLERSRALHASIYAGCADALSGLSLPIQRTRVQLAITIDSHCGVPADPESSPVPYLAPLQHTGALYATAHGGTVPSMFLGSPSIHAFMPREIGPDEDLPIPPGEGLPRSIASDPKLRHEAMDLVSAYGAFYEDFIVFGATPADLDAVLARGFVPRFRQQSFMIAEFRGCPVSLIVMQPPTEGAIELDYAPWPASRAVWQKQFALPTKTSGEPFEIRLDHTVCGDVLFRPIWRSSATPGKTARCAGSAPDGTMIIPAKAGMHVRCQLEF